MWASETKPQALMNKNFLFCNMKEYTVNKKILFLIQEEKVKENSHCNIGNIEIWKEGWEIVGKGERKRLAEAIL